MVQPAGADPADGSAGPGFRGWLVGYWDALRSPQTLAALRLTVGQAMLVTAVNVVMGTAIAWVLVRDHFPGKQLLEVVIDIPLPCRPSLPVWCCSACTGRRARGVNWATHRVAVFLPSFIVRTAGAARARAGGRRRRRHRSAPIG